MLFITSFLQYLIPASWKANLMAPRARSVHPLGPMKDRDRSEAMVDHIAGQLPDASASAVMAKRVNVVPNMLYARIR